MDTANDLRRRTSATPRTLAAYQVTGAWLNPQGQSPVPVRGCVRSSEIRELLDKKIAGKNRPSLSATFANYML